MFRRTGRQAARRRRCRCIVEERQRSRCPRAARNPSAAWGLRAISALLVVVDVPTSRPPRALSSPRKPHARDPS